MNIQILHSHLLEFLNTRAKPEKIAGCLSLCGPSVDHLDKFGKDYRYDIEVTTNRIDSANVMGIAREASAILPQFGLKADFKPLQLIKVPTVTSPMPLKIQINKKLNNRVMAVVMDVENKTTPKWMTERLEAAGMRSLNILIDITNYIMLEVGHPSHVFDYDEVKTHTLKFRLSEKGEKITTLDNKTYTLPGDDIVIDDGDGKIIDLPGIMGAKNSVVSDKTQRIIFFIDNNDARLMRKTSLALNIRTMAVQLNEKSVDPELGSLALNRAVDLYQKLASGKVVSKMQDYYPTPYKAKSIQLTFDAINQKIGVEINKTKILSILKALGFDTKTKNDNLEITVPSFRAHEVEIPEDIIEEIARIYGYFNLPPQIMLGAIPLEMTDKKFAFENKVKEILKGFGGIEVYTLSLVAKNMTGEKALKLKNPLGEDTEYLRTSLIPSLIAAYKTNPKEEKFHLFEMSNIYLPRNNDLPDEKMHLAGIFKGYSYRETKGIFEALFEILNIKHIGFEAEDQDGSSVAITADKQILGYIEKYQKDFAYEISMQALEEYSKPYLSYKAPAKYPAQIEDMTIKLSPETKVGDVIKKIKSVSGLIKKVELKDIYEQSYTFRIWYQDANKTLTDKEVEKVREKILAIF